MRVLICALCSILCLTGQEEKAKDLAAIIKGLNLKVQAQIEGEKLKVSSPKKDDLQAVIAHLRSIDFPVPINFGNYR